MSTQSRTDEIIEALAPTYLELSDWIWDNPELRFAETGAVAAQTKILQSAGFTVQAGVADIPTAFVAEAGNEGPVIAFLGEFDALSGLSQQAGIAEKRPVTEGGAGHGCGHNLLGAGSMLAAVAVRDYLTEHNLPGRVRYYGCPAEEGGSGKTFMARADAFAGSDAAFCWHPGTFNRLMPPNSLANIQAYFRFSGKAAHAAASPELGRSALDALELMSVGVQYLREHIPEKSRIHAATTKTGGISPNVIQDSAEALYLIRDPQIDTVLALFERVKKVANGAAMMTETSVEIVVDKACSNLLRNTTLDEVMQRQMERIGEITYQEEDLRIAESFHQTYADADTAALCRTWGVEFGPDLPALVGAVQPVPPPDAPMPGSTDVGDVSWQVPLSQVMTACNAVGTAFHSWALVAQGKTRAAHLGLLFAAKTMAASAVEVLHDADLLARAREEFAGRTAQTPYVCPIPPQVQLPFLRDA